MAWYDVNYSCGHSGKIQLIGPGRDRENRLAWLERDGLCPDCYKKYLNDKNSQKNYEMKVSYRDYKNKYSAYPTKKDSYDAKEKSIIIYIPRDLSAFNQFLGKVFGEEFGVANTKRFDTCKGTDKDRYISDVTEWITYWRSGLDMTNATPEEIEEVVSNLMNTSMKKWDEKH